MRTIYFGHNPNYLLACHDVTDIIAVFWHSGQGNLARRTQVMLEYCDCKKIISIHHASLNDEIKKIVSSLEPDLIIVGEYHFIIPEDIFSIPPLGTINMHGAPLPRYRGANPINWMIINGETEGAVTCHYITEGLDNGDIIDQYSFPILDTETAYEVRPKMDSTGMRLLIDVLKKFKKDGKISGTPQDESKSLYTPPRKPEDGLIEWNQSPKKIYDFVRALTRPYPGAFTILNGKRIYLWKVGRPKLNDNIPNNNTAPGTVLDINDSSLEIAVKGGTVRVLDWQVEDRKIQKNDLLLGMKLGN